MSIQEQLNKFISSSAGKKKIQEARNTAFKSDRPFGHLKNGTPVSAAQAKRYAEDMINEVLLALPDSLIFTQNPITRSSFLEPVITQSGDGYVVKIAFDPGAVHRDSLVPDVWEAGIPNIVVHLSNGWSARGAVHGAWHGKDTWSRSEYGGDLFMSEAINSFNDKHPLAVAELGSEYNM